MTQLFVTVCKNCAVFPTMPKKDSFAMIAMIGQFYKEQLFHGRNYEAGKMLYCGIRVMQQTKPGDVSKSFCTTLQLI